MAVWDENLVNAKYHLTVAKRMYSSYSDYEEKRFIVGVINELSRSVSSLIRSVLVLERKGGKDFNRNLKVFKKISGKYFEGEDVVNLFKILEIERAQKASPVEFMKKGNIILLIEGQYRVILPERFKDFLKSTEICIKSFQEEFRRV